MFDFIEDAADDVGDAVSDVVDAVGGAISDVAEWTAEALSSAGEWAADAVVDTVEWHIDATAAAGDAFLTALDDSGMFDAIDTVTVGLIDMEYDESGFSFNYGIEDVFGFGVKVGDGGIGADFDTVFSSYELAVGEDGFSAGATGGIDFGPFPYVEGHGSVEEDGDLGIGGEGHLYLPTPVGMAGGELAGDYQQTDDGYVVSGSLTGGYYAPTGSFVKGGVHASYEEDAEGYRSNVGLHGEVGQAGVGSVKSSLDYTEGRRGDVSYEGVTVSGGIDGMGMAAGGQVGYQHIATEDGEYDIVSGEVYGEAGGQRLTGRGAVVAGPDGVEVEGDVEFETDPLGVIRGAAGYAGLGEGTLPDGIERVPGIEGADDVMGGPAVARTGMAAAGKAEVIGDSAADPGGAAGAGFDDDRLDAVVEAAPTPDFAPPEPTVESAVDELSASFGDALDEATSEPPDDFVE